MVVARKLVPILAVLVLVLAGCTSGGGDDPLAGAGDDAPQVDATDTTGGIRGVVVDERIVPVQGASITINPGNKSISTDQNGLFAVSGLEPGEYFVKATHPLYNEVQQAATVVAGDAEPKPLKLQLTRVILANPYKETFVFDGFIACSQDFSGSLFSEECGEGVGVPGVGRVGGQSNNNVQYDFYPSVDNPKSILVELAWEPTVGAATTGALWTIVATDFVCDPTCSGTEVMNYGGNKYEGDDFGNCATNPSYIRQDDYVQTLNLTASTMISTFTWACGKGGSIPYDIEVNQQFKEFVTLSYYLPLPAGWSVVNGDPDPFA